MKKKCILVLLTMLVMLQMAACQINEKKEYKISVNGTTEESGVITYLGYEMNVYKDQVSNPCGSCPDQPVSVYVGANEKDIIEAIAKAITKADDIWTVEEQSDNEIILIEKESGTAKDIEKPTAPDGITIEGKIL